MGSGAQSVFHPVFRWLWYLHISFGTRRRKELSLDGLLYIIPQAWNRASGIQTVFIKIFGYRQQLVPGLEAFKGDELTYIQSPKAYQILTEIDHRLEAPVECPRRGARGRCPGRGSAL